MVCYNKYLLSNVKNGFKIAKPQRMTEKKTHKFHSVKTIKKQKNWCEVNAATYNSIAVIANIGTTI